MVKRGWLREEGMDLPILFHVVAANFVGTNKLLDNDPFLVKLPWSLPKKFHRLYFLGPCPSDRTTESPSTSPVCHFESLSGWGGLAELQAAGMNLRSPPGFFKTSLSNPRGKFADEVENGMISSSNPFRVIFLQTSYLLLARPIFRKRNSFFSP